MGPIIAMKFLGLKGTESLRKPVLANRGIKRKQTEGIVEQAFTTGFTNT